MFVVYVYIYFLPLLENPFAAPLHTHTVIHIYIVLVSVLLTALLCYLYAEGFENKAVYCIIRIIILLSGKGLWDVIEFSHNIKANNNR